MHVYGTPFFIEADLPTGNGRASTPFRRTMIAEDTGSAIVGPARADVYFGAGIEAGEAAGRVPKRHVSQCSRRASSIWLRGLQRAATPSAADDADTSASSASQQ